MQEEKITRRTFLRNCAIAAGLSGISMYGACWASNNLNITRVDINTGKLSKPFNAILFSDLHLSEHLPGYLLEDTINAIRSFETDMIFFTGDAITHDKEYTGFIKDIFPTFHSKYGNFAIIGNHDYRDGCNSTEVEKYLKQSGFEVLRNSSLETTVNKDKIMLYGLDDYWSGMQDVNATLKNLNKEKFNLLLTHQPTNIEELSTYEPDIALAGHTHGGQIYLPYVLNGIYKNIYDPRFIRGRYQVNNTTLYVNRGIGSTLTAMTVAGKRYAVPAIRLFATPEITLLKIS